MTTKVSTIANSFNSTCFFRACNDGETANVVLQYGSNTGPLTDTVAYVHSPLVSAFTSFPCKYRSNKKDSRAMPETAGAPLPSLSSNAPEATTNDPNSLSNSLYVLRKSASEATSLTTNDVAPETGFATAWKPTFFAPTSTSVWLSIRRFEFRDIPIGVIVANIPSASGVWAQESGLSVTAALTPIACARSGTKRLPT